MKEALMSMQVPGTLMSQARAIGVHWKMLTRMIAMPQAIDIPPRIMEAIRISLVGKIRQYMSKIEALVSDIVVT